MKYQFQFAGANASHRSTSQKSPLRLAILAAGLILAALAYANYLFNVVHLPFPLLYRPHTVAVATARPTNAAHPVAVTPPVQTETKESQPLSKTVKESTDDAIATVGSTVAKTLNVAPVVPMAPTPTVTATVVPAAPVTTAPVAVPVAKPEVVSVTTTPASQIISKPLPTSSRPPKVHTPQERLLLAGQAAFQTTLDLATKYPDAYGFRAEDLFADAKLGNPIPIYTVEESDRAKYQHGESVKPILKEASQWAFPVTVNNRVACMVTVSYSHHDYVPGKGSKILGMAWDKIIEKWPAEHGYHPCIVVNPDVPGYYFTVPELSVPNMTDIVRLFDFHMNLSPADVILASWR